MDNTRKNSVKSLLILPVKMICFLFCGFDKAELIKLANMAGNMHEEIGLLYPERLVITSINYRCTIHSLHYKFAWYFCLQLGFVRFSNRIWIVIFLSFICLSLVDLFRECWKMSLLWFAKRPTEITSLLSQRAIFVNSPLLFKFISKAELPTQWCALANKMQGQYENRLLWCL